MKKISIPLFTLLTGLIFVGAGCLGPSDAGGDGGVFKTENKAESWQQKVFVRKDERGRDVNIGNANVLSLVSHPTDSRVLYLGTRENGLWFTEDAAASWRLIGFPNQTVDKFSVDAKNKKRLLVALGSQIVMTEDITDPKNWRAVYVDNRNLRVTDVLIDQQNPKNLLAALSVGDVIQSRDGGLSWSVIYRFDKDQYAVNLLMDKFDSKIIYAPTNGYGLYKTTDGGKNWQAINDGFQPYAKSYQYRLMVQDLSKKNAFFHVSAYGILTTDDGGQSWKPLNLLTPPGTTTIYGLAVNPKNNKEIYYTTTSTLYKTIDGGLTWITKKTPGSRVGNVLLIDHYDPKKIYLGTFQPVQQKQGIF